MGFARPTGVQGALAPPLLAGKDACCIAATGSGKTGAYGIPLLQRAIAHYSRAAATPSAAALPLAVVLVPTRELVDQTAAVLASLAYYASDLFRVIDVGGASSGSLREQAARLAGGAGVIVATPARLLALLRPVGGKPAPLSLAATELLVVDEADMLLSFGYTADLQAVAAALPHTGAQTVLLSATLSPELDGVQRLLLRAPVVVNMMVGAGQGKLTQFYLRVGFKVDRYLLLFALFKLRLLAGRTLIFVNDVAAAFRVKLFLERFSIASAVLNAELPANSRAHLLASFNRGMFDILIATDDALPALVAAAADALPAAGGAGTKRRRAPADATAEAAAEGAGEGEGEEEDGAGSGAGAATASTGMECGAPAVRRKGGRAAMASTTAVDAAYGVSRGVDFVGVATVVNFDFPPTAAAYKHRIGRTARGGAAGVALTFVEPEGTVPEHDTLLARLQAGQAPAADSGAPQPSPLPFAVAEVEGFRYRVEDQLRSVTDARVAAARVADVRGELLASEALRAHFEDNPHDAEALQRVRHDKALAPGAAVPHLKDVPSYLVPAALRAAVESVGAGTSSGSGSGGGRRGSSGKQRRGGSGGASGPRGGGRRPQPATLEEAAASGARVSASTAVALSAHDAYHARRNNVDPLKALAARR
ncbi:MAG: DEAD/DEAH box helicase [Burkholderiaceae bacterium]|nr:DEAD/DEAH box helicase [Burkholderiaceae bacterium]